mmetsp:Transcript_27434/g.68166  ORF Transcript_27434/g.68166 Transcript_27434/m.68166 type:complete len:366 (+) Transcript_27434:1617-2714(+)
MRSRGGRESGVGRRSGGRRASVGGRRSVGGSGDGRESAGGGRSSGGRKRNGDRRSSGVGRKSGGGRSGRGRRSRFWGGRRSWRGGGRSGGGSRGVPCRLYFGGDGRRGAGMRRGMMRRGVLRRSGKASTVARRKECRQVQHRFVGIIDNSGHVDCWPSNVRRSDARESKLPLDMLELRDGSLHFLWLDPRHLCLRDRLTQLGALFLEKWSLFGGRADNLGVNAHHAGRRVFASARVGHWRGWPATGLRPGKATCRAESPDELVYFRAARRGFEGLEQLRDAALRARGQGDAERRASAVVFGIYGRSRLAKQADGRVMVCERVADERMQHRRAGGFILVAHVRASSKEHPEHVGPAALHNFHHCAS